MKKMTLLLLFFLAGCLSGPFVKARKQYHLGMKYYRYFKSLSANEIGIGKSQTRTLLAAYRRAAIELDKVQQFGSYYWSMCAQSKLADGKMHIVIAISDSLTASSVAKNDTKARLAKARKIDEKFLQPLIDDAMRRYQQVLLVSQKRKVANKCSRRARRVVAMWKREKARFYKALKAYKSLR